MPHHPATAIADLGVRGCAFEQPVTAADETALAGPAAAGVTGLAASRSDGPSCSVRDRGCRVLTSNRGIWRWISLIDCTAQPAARPDLLVQPAGPSSVIPAALSHAAAGLL
eukprot:363965-Chlamydomonas_euryale.AAC.24